MATKDFGVSLDFNKGTLTDLVLKDGAIKLKNTGITYDKSKTSYISNGIYISEVIDLYDKYTSLGNLALNLNLPTSNSSYKAYTKVSDDTYSWSDFIEIDYISGKMQSEPKRYIQVKIELFSNELLYDEVALSFLPSDKSRLANTEYITTDNNILELKKDYDFQMNYDVGNQIYKTKILSNKFKKIDKIRLKWM